MPGPADVKTVYLIGVCTFLLCVALLLVGRRIERTLELLNWIMVVCTLGGLLILSLLLVPFDTWLAAGAGLAGFDTARGVFDFLPAHADFFLLAAFVAYSGCGGMMNITLSNWARDKGYGMGQRAGYIPAAVGGQKIQLAATGFTFTPDAEALARWRGWWRIVRADQWGVFFVGAIAGMMLPALLYVTFLPAGADIRGLGISAALASSIGAREGALLAGAIAVLGAWLLFKTQLDLTEALVRAITDILWTGSRRVRAWRGGDVRLVYYTVLVHRRLVGHHRAAPRPADHPAADRGQRRRIRLRRRDAAPAVHQHAVPAARDPPVTRPLRRAGGDVAVLRVLRGAVDQECRRLRLPCIPSRCRRASSALSDSARGLEPVDLVHARGQRQGDLAAFDRRPIQRRHDLEPVKGVLEAAADAAAGRRRASRPSPGRRAACRGRSSSRRGRTASPSLVTARQPPPV